MEIPEEDPDDLHSDHSHMEEEEGIEGRMDDGEMVNGDDDDLEEDDVEFEDEEEEVEDEEELLQEDELGGLEEEEEETDTDMLMVNGDGDHEDDEDEELPDPDQDPESEPDAPLNNSQSNPEDEEEEGDPEYNCQVCGLVTISAKELFLHMESHDADEYAFSTEPSQLSGFGADGGGDRKWPSRFLKFPSPVFLKLSQFQENGNPEKLNGESGKSESGSEAESKLKTDLIPPRPTRNPFVRPRNLQNGMSGKLTFPARRTYACPHCRKAFQRADHFRQHLSNHRQGQGQESRRPFGCKICGDSFSAIVALRRHMLTHPNYKPFECSRCPRRFHDLALLKIHEESPYTHTETGVNGQAKLNGNSIRRKCRVCTQTFGNEMALAEHERRVHGRGQLTPILPILTCRYKSCRSVQPTLKLLIQHYKEVHGIDKLLREANRERNGAGTLSNGGTPVGKEAHAQAQVSNKNSLDSNNTTTNNNNTQPPRGKPTEECRLCFQFLFTIPERNQHESAVHNINHPSTVLQCKYPNCEKILGAKNWLARHIREHRQRILSGQDLDPYPVSGQTSPPPTTTTAFPDENMEEDEGEEEEPQPGQDDSSEGESEEIWDCRICDERFGIRAERESHEEQVHDTGNPRSEFLCKFCSREMGNFTSLLFHLNKSHRSQPGTAVQKIPPPPAPVPPPPASSSTPSVPLKPLKRLIFPCRHCDLTYSDQQVRVNHEYAEHGTKDALDNYFPCKVCGKVMTLRGLRKHLRKIHGQNPQVEVGENGGDPAGGLPPSVKLPNHQQNSADGLSPKTGAHPQKTPQSGPKSVYKRSSEPTTAAWVCRLCFQHFDEQRQRETHEHTAHGTHAPNATFVCKYSKCELEFGTFRALIKHLREHGETTLPTGQQKLSLSSLTQGKGSASGSQGSGNRSSSPARSGSGTALLRDDKDSLLWKCRLCWEVFPSQQHRLQHEINSHQTNHPSKSLLCKYCPKQFSLMRQLVKHLEAHGEGKQKGSSGISINRGEEEDEEDGGPPKLEPQAPQHRKPPPLFNIK